MNHSVRRTALALAAVTVAVVSIHAQMGLPKLPADLSKLRRLPSLSDLMGRDAITTTLDDAVTEVPFLDRFDPKAGSPFMDLPFGFDDAVTLVPGVWNAEMMGFCLQPGSGRPRSGDGYAWAPLKGPKADVVARILNRSASMRDIPQQDIQVLLWAIIAKSKVSTLDAGPRRAAEALLTKSQMASIDGSALDVLPSDWLSRLTSRVDEPVRAALDAENRIREALADPAGASYDELEQIAMREDVPMPKVPKRAVPHGRWSFHPGGYFIRFDPQGYQQMNLQLYVPEAFTTVRDGAGRIVELRDATGKALRRPSQAASSDAPVTVPGFIPSDRRQSPRGRDVADIASWAAATSDPADADLLFRAWASALADWASGGGTAENWGRGSFFPAAFFGKMTPGPNFQRGGGFGGGGFGGGGGGFGGGGGVGAPGGGGQRLGSSPRKGPNAADKARQAVDRGKGLLTKFSGAKGQGIGFSIPAWLFGKILDFNFDTWGQASDALGGDPPRSDFREFTRPTMPADIPDAPEDAQYPAADREKWKAVARDLQLANAYIAAGQIAMDRHGGAVQAGDRAWAFKQAQALIYLKREAGLADLKLAADLEAARPASAFSSAETEQFDEMIEGIKAMGERWAALPAIPAPWAAPGMQAQLVASR